MIQKNTRSYNQFIERLRKLGLIVTPENLPVTYTVFKNKASIIKYGDDAKVVFIGKPNESLFAFYPELDNDSNVMKAAYDMYKGFVNGQLDNYNRDLIQWTNGDIPKVYADLNTITQ